MADDTTGETKPQPKQEGAVINLVVKDQTAAEVHFKVKTHTKLEKVITAYCTKKAIEPSSVRFVFDGTRINPNSTPEDLGMEDGDSIDVFQEQVGGR
ncbi:MAG: small ubiquitin-like modifier 1 [Monoraphidium minutum]|nr:MAG: small ubiquitin-like modifier 1 [Monoraphidium minutum]